jgi:hypothetical protein
MFTKWLRMVMGFAAVMVLSGASRSFAGSMDSPSEPSDDAGRMYTLEQIYDVASGDEAAWPAKQAGGFTEPSAGPGATMHSLDDIQGVIAAGVTTAAAGDILSGKTAITRGVGTGEAVVTGTIAAQTLSADSETVTAGIYAGTTLSAVDADLATGNIRSGKTIFGINGAANVVDTTTGDAVAGEIVSGKKAWVDGSEVTGSMTDREGDNASTARAAAAGVNYLTGPAGYYDGDDRVSATDAQIAALDGDIAAGNIKDTVQIFGVTGTYAGGGGTTGLPKTGQTTSYDTGNLDDGALQRGIARSYTDNGDGTITDNTTGLMWVKSGYADTDTTPATTYTADTSWRKYTWADALSYCDRLDYAGYTDWRLPNIYELYSICLLEPTHGAPFIDTTVFTNTNSSYYWSGTTYPSLTTLALGVFFNAGPVNGNNKTNSYYVRPVRGGQ